ncbi:MAG: hypothetical protein ABSF54_17700 [Bryobacteraceae bacterium]
MNQPQLRAQDPGGFFEGLDALGHCSGESPAGESTMPAAGAGANPRVVRRRDRRRAEGECPPLQAMTTPVRLPLEMCEP